MSRKITQLSPSLTPTLDIIGYNTFFSINALPVSAVHNFDNPRMQKNNSWNKFQSNLFVAPTEKFDDIQYILDILKLHFDKRSRDDNSFWLIGINIDKNADEESAIMARFSDLDLDYDDDVFIYTVAGEVGGSTLN